MELQALLVLCGVGVAGVAVLLLMGLFSTSGTSYEEAIAQQRKAATELLALAVNKNKPKKNNKKAIKKQAKKEKKENAAAATGSEQESEAPAESGVEDDPTPAPVKAHVEFCPPVVVDVPRDTPPNVKIRKRGKDPKVKPILLNKEDPSCVSDPTSVPATSTLANHFEEMHPKDEFELLQSTLAAEKSQEKVEEVVEKKEAKAPKPVKAKNQAPKVTPPVEVAKEEAPRERHNSGDAPKEQRKINKKPEKKPEKPVEEVIEVREEVVPPLNVPQPSELTTDKLLKQALVTPPAAAPVAATSTPPGGKKKKKPEPNVLSLMAGDSGGVNIGELVRVVREAALSRTEIQILTDALLNKHHDTLPEHSEWTEGPNDPMQKLKKQLADKEKALGDEIEASQALHAKLKELRNTLNAERRTATNSARAAEAAAAAARAELHTLQARLQRLLDDNHAIAQEKLMAESALLSQVSGLQGECQAQALEAAQARLEAAQARDATIMAQQHAADMAQQLQEATCTCTELENQRQMAVHAEQLAQQELRQAQERLLAMTELQNEVQRLSSLVQAAEANAETAKEEAEKQKQQLLNDIASLREQLAATESELAEVKQMKAAPAQNGLPTNDQHKAAELAKVESVVESLRSELDAAQKCSREQREQLADLTRQLHTYQDKNNELRTKNWKVMEALQSAEKALQAKSTSAMPAQEPSETLTKAQEAQYNEVVSVLRAVCPSAAPSNAAGKEWLQTFADNLKKELEKRDNEKKELEKRQAEKELEKREIEKKLTAQVEQSAPPSDDRVNELQAQNEQLQSLVDKYKRIIDDTEGVLSRLQQNVTTEEARWSQQLADKQRELDDLRHTTVQQLQNKIDSLETELAQARTNNHNHSFADAERMTEERLMGGLSDKQNLDVCNGPSQVGLEK